MTVVDLTMCVNKDCPKKDNCRRYTTNPQRWESVERFTIGFGRDRCIFYSPKGANK